MATEMLQYLNLDGLDETVLNIGEIKTNLEGQMQDLPYARPDGLYPDMTVGAVIGADTTAQWATRESTGSGAAIVRSVQGAAVAWNQLINSSTPLPQTSLNGITITNNGDGTYTVNGTATSLTFLNIEPAKSYKSHKHLLKGCPANDSGCSLRMRGSGTDVIDTGSGTFWDATDNTWKAPVVYVDNGATVDNLVFTPQLFDLTAMFGSGNEPATVEEFERMYPEPYYPYSAPTLKPVQIAGIRSTGRNLINLKSPYGSGAYNQEAGYQITAGTPGAMPSGENPCVITVPQAWYSVTFVSAPLEVGKSYRFVLTSATDAIRASIYMLDSNHVVTRRVSNYAGQTSIASNVTVASGEAYFAVFCGSNVVTTLALTNVMLQVATADFNTYKPYTSDSVEWETQTLRAAGSVADELTASELVTRVGERTYQSGDESDATVRTDGTTTYYPLATPTTTTISPALDMTYRVQAGGSESIIVPAGEVSAAPVLTVAEPVNAGDEFARIWAAIQSLGYTRNTEQLSRPVSLTDIGSIDEVQKDTTDIVEIDTTKEVTE